ncbi:MAG: hypothetical protein J6X99_07565 [Bacteroidales bacterium]|nr:hypothetical protein [Bacteroidales bacterium]
MKRLIVLALLTVVTAFSASSQEMTSLLFRPPVQSPELSEEGLTLRYRAPKARQASLMASWTGYRPVPMQQDAEGVWSITPPNPNYTPTPSWWTAWRRNLDSFVQLTFK